MKASQKYSFGDFTRSNYRKLLQLAKRHYEFTRYLDLKGSKPCVLWRHDVDFSPHAAQKIAEIDARENAQTTFFFHLHNPFYNLLDGRIVQIVQNIAGLGHEVGIHFDAGFYGVEDEKGLVRYLSFEKMIFKAALGISARVFSFHNPTSKILRMDGFRYAGIVNAYAGRFMKNFGYCSDSNGVWRHRRLEDVLREHNEERLQVLTHPAWWQTRPMAPRERIFRCAHGRAKRCMQDYDALFFKSHRKNIGCRNE